MFSSRQRYAIECIANLLFVICFQLSIVFFILFKQDLAPSRADYPLLHPMRCAVTEGLSPPPLQNFSVAASEHRL